MLHEIIRQPVAAMAEQSRMIAAADQDPEVKVAALILSSFNELFSNQDAFAILYNERHFLRGSPSFAYVVRAKARVYDAWKRTLEAGVALGRFRPSLDTFLTITTIVRMLNTGADWFRHGAEHEPLTPSPTAEHLIAFNLAFVFAAIRHPGLAEQPVPRHRAEELLRHTGMAIAPADRSGRL